MRSFFMHDIVQTGKIYVATLIPSNLGWCFNNAPHFTRITFLEDLQRRKIRIREAEKARRGHWKEKAVSAVSSWVEKTRGRRPEWELES